MTTIETGYRPSLYEISQLSRDFGLVGERDTHLTVFLSFLKGGMVAMTGLSRGGKDFVTDAANFCMPRDEVFKVPTSTSKVALYEKEDQMNNARVHRYPDIATLEDKSHLEEIMKAHGEGRTITHERALPGGGTESFTLTPPDCFILFVASDNQQVDLNDYPELRNRAITVSIDASKELTERVNDNQAKRMAGLDEPNYTKEERDIFRNYVGSIPVKTYASSSGMNGETLNPVAVALNDQNPLPQHFTEARQDFPRLMDFVRSISMFHAGGVGSAKSRRMEEALPGRDADVTLLITPADVWYGMRVFGEQMILSALNLRDKDFEMLSLIRDAGGAGITAATIQSEMRELGFNITNRDVRSALENMLTKGYVKKDQNASPIEWAGTAFADKAKRDFSLDWEELVEKTKETATEALPGKVADEYIDTYCTGDGLFVTHPFNGERMNITKTNIEEEKVEEAADEMDEQVFGEDLYGTSDTSSGSSQGQLG